MKQISMKDKNFIIYNDEILGYTGKESHLVIPKNIKFIHNYAFKDSNIVSLSFEPESSLLRLGQEAFSENTNLVSVDLSNTLMLEEISNRCFYSCNQLTTVKLPEKLRFINEYAFAYCAKLQKIDIPIYLEKIEKCAFTDCLSLTQLYIPKSLRVFEYHTFFEVFSENFSLEIHPRNPFYFLHNGDLTNVYNPDNILPIESLIQKKFLPPKFMKNINHVFLQMLIRFKNTESIDLYVPSFIESIEWNFKEPKSVPINFYIENNQSPKNVGYVQINFFNNASNVHFNSQMPSYDFYEDQFDYDDSVFNAQRYACETYTSKKLSELDLYMIVRNETILEELKNKTMHNIAYNEMIIDKNKGVLKKITHENGFFEITIPKEIKIIPKNFCTDNIYVIAIKVEKDSLLEKIESNCFNNCSNLVLIDLRYATNLTNINSETVSNNVGLTNILLPDNSLTIADRVFMNLPYLKYINIPRNLKKIGFYSLSGLSSETTIESESKHFQFIKGNIYDINEKKLLTRIHTINDNAIFIDSPREFDFTNAFVKNEYDNFIKTYFIPKELLENKYVLFPKNTFVVTNIVDEKLIYNKPRNIVTAFDIETFLQESSIINSKDKKMEAIYKPITNIQYPIVDDAISDEKYKLEKDKLLRKLTNIKVLTSSLFEKIEMFNDDIDVIEKAFRIEFEVFSSIDNFKYMGSPSSRITTNIQSMLRLVKIYGLALANGSAEVKKNKEVAIEAIKNDIASYIYIDPSLKSNTDIIKIFTQQEKLNEIRPRYKWLIDLLEVNVIEQSIKELNLDTLLKTKDLNIITDYISKNHDKLIPHWFVPYMFALSPVSMNNDLLIYLFQCMKLNRGDLFYYTNDLFSDIDEFIYQYLKDNFEDIMYQRKYLPNSFDNFMDKYHLYYERENDYLDDCDEE